MDHDRIYARVNMNLLFIKNTGILGLIKPFISGHLLMNIDGELNVIHVEDRKVKSSLFSNFRASHVNTANPIRAAP